MTTEQAIYQLTDLIKDRESFMVGDYDKSIYDRDKEALQTAITALEKQVPKKVIWESAKNGKIYAFYWACCPNCGNDICDEDNVELKFCTDCGQALDWEGNEDE